MKSTNEATDFDNETPVRNRSPTDMSTGDNLDFDSPTVRSHRSEDTERSEDEESNPEIIENASVKTRYGRLSKKRYQDSESSYNKANSSSSEVPMSTDSLSPKSAKQKKGTIQKKQAPRSSNQSRSSSRSMRRSTRNSSFPPISTDSEEKMESEDAPREFDCDDESSMRNDSPRNMSIDDNFNFDHSPEKENDSGIIGNEITKKRYERSKRRYSDSADDSNSHPEDSGDENDDLEKSQDLMESSNKAYDSDNETLVKSLEHSGISIDDNFDFDPPTERSHRSEETEMRKDDEKDDPEMTGNPAVKTQRSETLTKNKIRSSTSHTPKTPKRKADESAGSSTSKRTKPLPEESMNPGDMNDNISQDDPSRIELNPSRGPLGLSNETQKDSDVQKIPKPRPQVMEAPIIEEYGEETQTSLETVLKAFKSLIISLDTPGLSQFLIELDTKIMESGRRSEISNKEVTVAMDFLIVKLSKHGAPESSEDSISLRDILLMLRTIILNSSFNGLELEIRIIIVFFTESSDVEGGICSSCHIG
ncbi:hypothetical protein CAEBREN_00300 [Caenorhabditis brenneri]|uniref:SPK domain-containing protein n=1 Tax=Caenorhabditis brenneri TaxID=135651 RepID=G0NIK7_CAEBE|nr:hypothetical protein CAEBREN_00300 [Caenorhabditis brenneri]